MIITTIVHCNTFDYSLHMVWENNKFATMNLPELGKVLKTSGGGGAHFLHWRRIKHVSNIFAHLMCRRNIFWQKRFCPKIVFWQIKKIGKKNLVEKITLSWLSTTPIFNTNHYQTLVVWGKLDHKIDWMAGISVL